MNNTTSAAVEIFIALISLLGIAACTIRNIARLGTLRKRGMIASLFGLIIVLGLFAISGFRQQFFLGLIIFWPLTLLFIAIANLIVSLYSDPKGIWSVIAGIAAVVFLCLAAITRGGASIRYG
jgi:hypothetical protein